MAINPNKPRKLPGGILVFVLSILSIVLMTAWAGEGASGTLHAVRSGVETVTAPIKNIGAVVGTPFRAVGDFIAGVTTSSESVDELRAQNELLRSQIIRMEEYRQENERLSALLDLKDAYQLESSAARVIATEPDSWNRVITINKGSESGFSVGMPVMSPNGLLGQIERVSPNSSEVRLITDQKSGVSVFVQENRAEGILSGSVDGILYLQFIGTEIEVNVGDKITTSGSGGIYPKGIPIGEVLSVEQAPADVYKTIIVAPISKVSTYEEVLVITGSEDAIVTTDDTQSNQESGEGNAGANGATDSSDGASGDGAADNTSGDGTNAPEGAE